MAAAVDTSWDIVATSDDLDGIGGRNRARDAIVTVHYGKAWPGRPT
jgi:hypothetical protein